MFHTKKMDPNLYKAAMLSNIEVLRQLKDQLGVQLTANKSTVLHVAAQFHDNDECVQVILNLQPSLLCQVNSKRETALHIAARNGHSNTVRVLIQQTKSLKCGLNINSNSILMYRSWISLASIFRIWLISEKNMIWIPNNHENTALHEAARNNHLDAVEMLVREDAVSPRVDNNFGETPLYIAAEKDSHSHAIVSTILNSCKSPAHSGPDGKTALHAVVIAGCLECTKKILEKKPKLIKEVDMDGWTPLHYAAREGHTDIMKELLSHSPDCWEIVNDKGQNILHIAKEHGTEVAIKFIGGRRVENSNIEHGTEVAIKFIGGRSVENSNIENQMDNEGDTPFNRNVKNSWLSNLKNQMDNDGNTPGSLSIIKGNKRKEGEIKEDPKAEDTENGKEVYNKMHETQLVVAALIATVTFTAGLTVPGGYHSNEGPDQGRAVLVRIAAFKTFVITNALAMTLSVAAIFVHMLSMESRKPGVLGAQLLSGMALTFYAMIAMMIAFISGSYAVLSNSSDLAIRILIIGSSLPLLLIYFQFGAALTLRIMRKMGVRRLEK